MPEIGRREFLKLSAVAAGSAALAVAGRFLTGSSRQIPDQTPSTPVPIAESTKKPVEPIKETPMRLLDGRDYSVIVEPKIWHQLAITEATFRNLSATATILAPDPAISHPRVSEQGLDPFFDWFIWSVNNSPSRLSLPAKEEITVKPDQKESPVRLFGLPIFGAATKVSMEIYIPEDVLSPKLSAINGMNIYYDSLNLPGGPQLRPIDTGSEGPFIALVDLKTVGRLNEGLVRGTPFLPGRYTVISSLFETVRKPDGKPDLKNGVKFIFWSKRTDPIKDNLMLLSIKL